MRTESEAKDAARIALSVAPWYTIGGGYAEKVVAVAAVAIEIAARQRTQCALDWRDPEEMKKLVNMENVDAKLAKNILEGVGTEIAKNTSILS